MANIQNRGEGIGVAGVSSDAQTGTMFIKYSIDGRTSKLETTNKRIEPLCYPLLFPFGENGWGVELSRGRIQNKIDYMPYLASRILKPETGLYANNQNGDRILVNRFQLMSRLMQYYIVESVSRAIDYRLEWHKNNKSTIFGQPQTEVNEINDDNDELLNQVNNHQHDEEEIDPERTTHNNSNVTYLAESFTGSPRHLRSLAIDAMTIVSELGESTAFVTVTFNPNWPELKDRLLDGQKIYDRPDVACLVFKARLSALNHNIRHGKYFGGAKTEYFLYVIEYQFRGLPHAHIVFRLHNAPSTTDEKLNFIDQHISAKYPNPFHELNDDELQLLTNDQFDKYQKEKDNHTRYCELIDNYMTHSCSTAVNGCQDKNGLCKRGYMTRKTNTMTSFDNKGYPVYYRPTENDLKVVPHNKEMLMDWDGHINVEYCGKTYAVMYLYNYLFKGITNNH
jgi:hypothetical protein